MAQQTPPSSTAGTTSGTSTAAAPRTVVGFRVEGVAPSPDTRSAFLSNSERLQGVGSPAPVIIPPRFNVSTSSITARPSLLAEAAAATPASQAATQPDDFPPAARPTASLLLPGAPPPPPITPVAAPPMPTNTPGPAFHTLATPSPGPPAALPVVAAPAPAPAAQPPPLPPAARIASAVSTPGPATPTPTPAAPTHLPAPPAGVRTPTPPPAPAAHPAHPASPYAITPVGTPGSMMHSEPKPILQSSKAEAAHADLVQQQVLSPSADSDAALSVTSGVSTAIFRTDESQVNRGATSSPRRSSAAAHPPRLPPHPPHQHVPQPAAQQQRTSTPSRLSAANVAAVSAAAAASPAAAAAAAAAGVPAAPVSTPGPAAGPQAPQALAPPAAASRSHGGAGAPAAPAAPPAAKPAKEMTRAERRAVQEAQRAAKAAQQLAGAASKPAAPGGAAGAPGRSTGPGSTTSVGRSTSFRGDPGRPAGARSAATTHGGASTPGGAAAGGARGASDSVSEGGGRALHLTQHGSDTSGLASPAAAAGDAHGGGARHAKRHHQHGGHRVVSLNPSEMFTHLPQHKQVTMESVLGQRDVRGVPPEVLQLGLKYADGTVTGATARSLALLNVLEQVIRGYSTPPSARLNRDLTQHLNGIIDFLVKCRPLALSMGNVIKWLKLRVAAVPPEMPEAEAKQQLVGEIREFALTRIHQAHIWLTRLAVDKVDDGDVVLTFAYSCIVSRVLREAARPSAGAAHAPKRFRVVVVDARPEQEGLKTLQTLQAAGIACTYAHINALSFVMTTASKVFLGASAVMSNGTVMARAGSAAVAMVAHARRKPVLVCCESFKFHERVQLDAVTHNELGDPQALASVAGRPDVQALQGWQGNPRLALLNLKYDAMPAQFVTAIVTEHALIPPTSVQAMLREYQQASREG